MRVTKIIREYVEKTVGDKYSKMRKELEKPTSIIESDAYDQYCEWAEQAAKEVAQAAVVKAEELGLTVREGDVYVQYSQKKPVVEAFETLIIEKLRRPDYFIDKDLDAYNNRINELHTEEAEKIQEILIGLEIGDVNKKELEEVLAPFKI